MTGRDTIMRFSLRHGRATLHLHSEFEIFESGTVKLNQPRNIKQVVRLLPIGDYKHYCTNHI